MKKNLTPEARDNWIAAQVDALMDDEDFLAHWAESYISITLQAAAKEQAELDWNEVEAEIVQAAADDGLYS